MKQITRINEHLASIRKGMFGFALVTLIPALIGGFFLFTGDWITGSLLWAFGFYNVYAHDFGGDE